MAKYGFKEQMKIGANENKYVKTLTKEQKNTFKALSREEKDEIILKFANGEEVEPIEESTNHEAWLKRKGIHHPTNVTLDAIYPLVSDSKLSSFSNTMGTFTMDIHKQAEMFNNLILQKQNYALIAQQDEIIKQNDHIIQLLKQIAEK